MAKKTFSPQYLKMAKKLYLYGAKHGTSMQPYFEAQAANSTFNTAQAALNSFILANPRANETP